MKHYAQHLHHLPNPWDGDVPPWALELREIGFFIIRNQEIIMSSLDEAKAGEAAAIDAINKLVAEVQRLGAKITGQAPPPATDADLTQLATDLQNVAKTGTDAVTASQTAVP